jgi:glycosyltransferase involved in cell wall biosynthesis
VGDGAAAGERVSGERPLVSAVVPVHNGERFVAEAIESVLAQTYAPLECVVVDDDSTDGTAAVLDRFGGRIVRVASSARNAAAARNAGVAAARGELLAFLDADDLWEPAKIERQVELMRSDGGLGLVYCGLAFVGEDGRPLGSASPPEPAAALRNTLLSEPPFVGLAQTGLVRRTAFEACDGFDTSMRRAEDGDLTWRLAARFRVAAVPEPLARYRHHPAQKHRTPEGFEEAGRHMLGKAFSSGLLPPDVQPLERQAYAHLAFILFTVHRAGGGPRSLRYLLRALRLDPVGTTRRLVRR